MAEFLLLQNPEASRAIRRPLKQTSAVLIKILHWKSIGPSNERRRQSSDELSDRFKLDGWIWAKSFVLKVQITERVGKSIQWPYLPIGAVFKPVADLVLGLEEIVFEGRRSSPTYNQLIIEIAHAAHVHIRWRIRRHWKGEEKRVWYG